MPITCTSIDCPERKSLCCGAMSTIAGLEDSWDSAMGSTQYFACSACGEEFQGGECKELTQSGKRKVRVVSTKDSNDLDTEIKKSCWECGVTANVLTCLKKYGRPPKQVAYTVSTYHKGTCDFCKEEKDITETRDFFYPDYSLIASTVSTFTSPNTP